MIALSLTNFDMIFEYRIIRIFYIDEISIIVFSVSQSRLENAIVRLPLK